MANIFSLFGTIFIDNKEADKSIDETTKKGESAGSKIGKAFNTIGSAAVTMGKAAVDGAVKIGSTAYDMASNTAAQADQIDKMSQKLGMSRTAYQEWDFVLSQAGVDITSMQSGLKTLTNKIDAAKNGTEDAQEMFKKLGISLDDLNSMSREEIFDSVISGMQGMEDTSERAALANDLLGKSGQNLTALFNSTAESTKELKQQAHDLGMVMSDDAINAGVKFTDSMDVIKRSIESMKNTLGATVLPIVQSVLTLIIDKMPSIQSTFGKLSPIVQSLFDNILPPLFDLTDVVLPILFDLINALLPPLQNILSAILPVLVSIINKTIPPLMQVVQAILPVIVSLVDELTPILADIIDTSLTVLIELLNALLPVFEQLVKTVLPPLVSIIKSLTLNELMSFLTEVAELFKSGLDTIKSIVTNVLNGIKNFFISIFEIYKTIYTTAFEALKNIVSKALEKIKEFFSKIFDKIKSIVTSIFDGIKTYFVTIFNVYKTIYTTAFEAIKNIVSKALEKIKETFSKIFDGIKSKINDFINNFKSAITSGFDTVKNIVDKTLNTIKQKFVNIFENVKNVVKTAIDKIKSFFNFEVKLPHIKLPHFSIKPSGWQIGDLLDGEIPSLGIEWYAKGGILKKPTVFDIDEATNTVRAGGEAGDEAVAPIGLLLNYIRQAVRETVTQESPAKTKGGINVNVTVNIDNVTNNTEKDVDDFIDLIMIKIDQKIKRKGVVFG